MSNLARYFLSKGLNVGGYDRTETALTQALQQEGAFVHYEDRVEDIPLVFTENKEHTLVVFTPAVPASHRELLFFREQGYTIMKRAQVLGEITKTSNAICVAGTHGKTTVSSMTAHLLRQSHIDCNAFLGGILKNYNNNLLLSEKSNITVAEADEYDRSFIGCAPGLPSSTSPIPITDIYGTGEAYRESFEVYFSFVQRFLDYEKGVSLTLTKRRRRDIQKKVIIMQNTDW